MKNLVRIDMHPHGGIAGDMFAAAMGDAFSELRETVQSDIASLCINGLSCQTHEAMSAGLRGCRFEVIQKVEQKPPRTFDQVKKFLQQTALQDSVARVAIGIYRYLAEAEASVHGKTVETIHFHEVSDWDSMVDIVAAAGFISRLGQPNWRVAPLPTGGGTVKTAHGDIPVPAPATLVLLDGFEWIDDGVAGERVTPTGAAILRYLQPQAMGNATSPAVMQATGQGCGTKELPGRANVFRVSAYTSASTSSAARAVEVLEDTIVKLEFEIDDMTGEELAVAQQHIRDHAKVLDVCSKVLHGKKGRSVTGVQILAQEDALDEITEICFNWSTTLGIRYSTLQRRILAREHVENIGIRVKQTTRRTGNTAKAESDDLARATSLAERRAMARKAEQVVLGNTKQ